MEMGSLEVFLGCCPHGKDGWPEILSIIESLIQYALIINFKLFHFLLCFSIVLLLLLIVVFPLPLWASFSFFFFFFFPPSLILSDNWTCYKNINLYFLSSHLSDLCLVDLTSVE